MRLNGVEMIPSSLVACFINKKEVRILEISTEGFSFRIPTYVKTIESIQLYYLIFKESRYEGFVLNDYEILEQSQEEFYYIYTIGCKEERYKVYTSMIIRDYTEYVMLKLSGDDAYCSQEKVSYPAELDLQYAANFSEQKREWLENVSDPEPDHSNTLDRLELAISMDQPRSYKTYLLMGIDTYVQEYWKENHLSDHWLANKPVQRIYIGNEFCHNLFPTEGQLIHMLEKAKNEKIGVTLAFTYMRDELLEKMEILLNKIYDWCEENETRIEIIVNDWGMLKLLKDKKNYFVLALGILLNKRRKDPRYPYKSGYHEHVNQLMQNSLNSADYRSWLEQKNITRYEYETCGYRLEIPTEHNSLHFPFYQTNTSQFCTLYAKCVNQERGKQQMVYQCPRYCEEFVFAYPKHLKMVGKYNSLFGFDASLLNDPAEIDYYAKHGIDRLVLNLL